EPFTVNSNLTCLVSRTIHQATPGTVPCPERLNTMCIPVLLYFVKFVLEDCLKNKTIMLPFAVHYQCPVAQALTMSFTKKDYPPTSLYRCLKMRPPSLNSHGLQ
ncbi:hypothetical protein OS493_040283, partial [Desmophyllum pertusum]